MLLESDLLVAYIKKEDWLKKTAVSVIEAVEEKRLYPVQLSSEVFHELYYVFSDLAPVDVILANEAKIATIKNLVIVNPSPEIYLSALNLMETYTMTSIFDAIYAATALSRSVPDHSILSTEHTYDQIKGIQRVDPRELKV